MSPKIIKELKRLIVVILAALLMSVNIRTFVRTGGLYPGGATGLTILIQRVVELYLHVELPYTLINILTNAVPVYIGFRFIGRKFTLYSLFMILLNGFFVDFLPAYAITYDTLLISIFGGIINGVAISMCLSVDATSGGTDFIAIYLSQKKGVDSFNIILGVNVVILAAAGLIFGWDKALYSIVFQYVSTQTLHLLYRNYQQQTLFIITEKPDEVCHAMYDVCHHGATILDAKGSYQHTSRELVYSVVSGTDEKKAIQAIHSVDPDAFINSIKTSELRGNFYMQPKD
ncbi:MAG: YitT family protein [Firmicutes bacterium]|nr:YitT family protein [Bacillota bacterium]